MRGARKAIRGRLGASDLSPEWGGGLPLSLVTRLAKEDAKGFF